LTFVQQTIWEKRFCEGVAEEENPETYSSSAERAASVLGRRAHASFDVFEAEGYEKKENEPKKTLHETRIELQHKAESHSHCFEAHAECNPVGLSTRIDCVSNVTDYQQPSIHGSHY